jgi:hypothetical protein
LFVFAVLGMKPKVYLSYALSSFGDVDLIVLFCFCGSGDWIFILSLRQFLASRAQSSYLCHQGSWDYRRTPLLKCSSLSSLNHKSDLFFKDNNLIYGTHLANILQVHQLNLSILQLWIQVLFSTLGNSQTHRKEEKVHRALFYQTIQFNNILTIRIFPLSIPCTIFC